MFCFNVFEKYRKFVADLFFSLREPGAPGASGAAVSLQKSATEALSAVRSLARSNQRAVRALTNSFAALPPDDGRGAERSKLLRSFSALASEAELYGCTDSKTASLVASYNFPVSPAEVVQLVARAPCDGGGSDRVRALRSSLSDKDEVLESMQHVVEAKRERIAQLKEDLRCAREAKSTASFCARLITPPSPAPACPGDNARRTERRAATAQLSQERRRLKDLQVTKQELEGTVHELRAKLAQSRLDAASAASGAKDELMQLRNENKVLKMENLTRRRQLTALQHEAKSTQKSSSPKKRRSRGVSLSTRRDTSRGVTAASETCIEDELETPSLSILPYVPSPPNTAEPKVYQARAAPNRKQTAVQSEPVAAADAWHTAVAHALTALGATLPPQEAFESAGLAQLITAAEKAHAQITQLFKEKTAAEQACQELTKQLRSDAHTRSSEAAASQEANARLQCEVAFLRTVTQAHQAPSRPVGYSSLLGTESDEDSTPPPSPSPSPSPPPPPLQPPPPSHAKNLERRLQSAQKSSKKLVKSLRREIQDKQKIIKHLQLQVAGLARRPHFAGLQPMPTARHRHEAAEMLLRDIAARFERDLERHRLNAQRERSLMAQNRRLHAAFHVADRGKPCPLSANETQLRRIEKLQRENNELRKAHTTLVSEFAEYIEETSRQSMSDGRSSPLLSPAAGQRRGAKPRAPARSVRRARGGESFTPPVVSPLRRVQQTERR
eukprot:gnl/Chilomastix_cuspidata/4428.p1 GENE.gnl/Chilomastix_cuspidata/4428~~gnl/Chilomastix_cuspidata/4428.p1  ORF type:complete len:729 (-),score=121.43 gnl/Chilomastix_cuspidata/4428:1832-4018(-)